MVSSTSGMLMAVCPLRLAAAARRGGPELVGADDRAARRKQRVHRP
jgi:hypothetical protein